MLVAIMSAIMAMFSDAAYTKHKNADVMERKYNEVKTCVGISRNMIETGRSLHFNTLDVTFKKFESFIRFIDALKTSDEKYRFNDAKVNHIKRDFETIRHIHSVCESVIEKCVKSESDTTKCKTDAIIMHDMLLRSSSLFSNESAKYYDGNIMR